MNNSLPFQVLELAYEQAIAWVVTRLEASGMHILKTFDLQAAQMGHDLCPCPHHGTELCDCQLGVLLVYQGNTEPVTLVVHGCDGMTWIALTGQPRPAHDEELRQLIRKSLIILQPTNQLEVAHVD